MHLRKIFLLATLPLLLTACGEEKKVDMNISGVHSAVVDIVNTPTAVPTQPVNSVWEEEFGKNLAPYQSVSWEESFDIVHDNSTIVSVIDLRTKIADRNADNLYMINTFKIDAADKKRIAEAYLGIGPYYVIGYDNEGLNPKSYYDELIDDNNSIIQRIEGELLQLQSSSTSKQQDIEYLQNDIDRLNKENDEYRKLKANAPDEWSVDDEFKYERYWAYAEDGKTKVNLRFYSFHNSDQIGFEITNYPAGKDIESASHEEKEEFANNLLSKLNLPPCKLGDEGSMESLSDGKFHPCYWSNYSMYDPTGNPSSDKMQDYDFFFLNDTVEFRAHFPVEIVSHTQNVTLLSLSEIQKIAKTYIEEAVIKYQFETDPYLFSDYANEETYEYIALEGLFPLETSQIKINDAVLTLQVNYKENYIGPVWLIYAKKTHTENGTKALLFGINAIDGSIVK